MISVRNCASLVLGDLLQQQPLSEGKVRLAWTTAVGTSLARVTTVSLHSDGTLFVQASDNHWRRETVRIVPVVRKRLASLLGKGVVKSITVTNKGMGSHA